MLYVKKTINKIFKNFLLMIGLLSIFLFINFGEAFATINATYNLSVVKVSDGVEGGNNVTFEIRSDSVNNSGSAILGDIVWSGSAGNGIDYNAAPATFSIPNGQDRVAISLPVIDDASVEPTENITLTISNIHQNLSNEKNFMGSIFPTANIDFNNFADFNAVNIEIISVNNAGDAYVLDHTTNPVEAWCDDNTDWNDLHSKYSKIYMMISGSNPGYVNLVSDNAKKTNAINLIKNKAIERGMKGVIVDFEPISNGVLDTQAKKDSYQAFLTDLTNSLDLVGIETIVALPAYWRPNIEAAHAFTYQEIAAFHPKLIAYIMDQDVMYDFGHSYGVVNFNVDGASDAVNGVAYPHGAKYAAALAKDKFGADRLIIQTANYGYVSSGEYAFDLKYGTDQLAHPVGGITHNNFDDMSDNDNNGFAIIYGAGTVDQTDETNSPQTPAGTPVALSMTSGSTAYTAYRKTYPASQDWSGNTGIAIDTKGIQSNDISAALVYISDSANNYDYWDVTNSIANSYSRINLDFANRVTQNVDLTDVNKIQFRYKVNNGTTAVWYVDSVYTYSGAVGASRNDAGYWVWTDNGGTTYKAEADATTLQTQIDYYKDTLGIKSFSLWAMHNNGATYDVGVKNIISNIASSSDTANITDNDSNSSAGGKSGPSRHFTDKDGDGVKDKNEKNVDTDGDGINDNEESNKRDTDNDGVDDEHDAENKNPYNDTDGDGFSNFAERQAGTDPMNPNSKPGSKEDVGNDSNKTCSPYFIKYQNTGDEGEEVFKIQRFLKSQGFFQSTINGIYDIDTKNAVKAFQLKYTKEVLSPWGITRPTGWWYKTSMKKGNDIVGCSYEKNDNKKVNSLIPNLDGKTNDEKISILKSVIEELAKQLKIALEKK